MVTTTELSTIAERLLDLVGDRAEAEATVSASDSGLTRFANSFIHQHVGERTVSVSLKCAVDGRVASASTTDVSDDGLSALVEQVLGAAGVRPVDPHWPGVADPAGLPDVAGPDAATEGTQPTDRATHVRAFVDAAPELRAAGYVDTEVGSVAFANSADHRGSGGWTRATVDGIHQTPTSAGSAHQTSTRFSDLDGGAAGLVASELARRGEEPIDVDPGRYEVVLSPEAVSTILIFLSLYGFNAKQHLEGQSFVRLGEDQFDPNISFWDDGTDPRAISLPFDTEGTPKRRLDLVTNGTTTALAHDRRTAARSDATSTGHAIPGGESLGPVPVNLFLQPGESSRDELISQVERGILVTTFNYCRVLDPKTQVVTGLTRNGTFLIEGGEIAKPLTNLRFTQAFVDALSGGRVLGVGSDARFGDSEIGPGMVYVPSLRLAEWNFTGGAQG